ncbi:MAG: carbamoyltransferase HypF, partial [Planctomycetes bacterium]|nr:carbamoyltransferase HypF [Planctomycetota bacterium]
VCDDSVAAVQRGRPMVLRRGRGYAPRPLALPVASPRPILAAGPEMKTAVCLVRGREAFVSQHIGDLRNALAAGYFETTIEKLERLLEIAPAAVAHDLHPGYLSTRYARRRAATGGVRLIGVQHHHAHAASVMAECGLDGEVLALVMDGTGYGPDGTVWGGEVLRASAAAFERLGHLAYVPLPGGDAAVEHPVRTAWALLVGAYGAEAAEDHRVGLLASDLARDRHLWTEMITRRVNSPRACGLGRLFDGASVLAGVCAESTYEGQAAMELEAAAAVAGEAEPYEFALRDMLADDPDGAAGWVIETAPAVRGLVADMHAGRGAAHAAARFHATVAAMLRAAARRARDETRLGRIVLSGGCFANARLVGLLAPALESDGFDVYVHAEVPPGDGGVALGQAYVAAARLAAEA